MEPLNIQRLVKQNNQYAEASRHAASVIKGSIVSGWHEKHDSRGRIPAAGDSCSQRVAIGADPTSNSNWGRATTTASSSDRTTSSSSGSTSRGAAGPQGAFQHEVQHIKQALLEGE
jgi:hypothetical protein